MVGPAAAPSLLFLPPRPVFCPGTTPPLWFCLVPQDAAASNTDNKPPPSARGRVQDQPRLFPVKPIARPVPSTGLLCEGLALFKA